LLDVDASLTTGLSVTVGDPGVFDSKPVQDDRRGGAGPVGLQQEIGPHQDEPADLHPASEQWPDRDLGLGPAQAHHVGPGPPEGISDVDVAGGDREAREQPDG
jgi:hypothetical protein